MYVPVHKIGNQWFRDDNGTLVGTESPQLLDKYKKILKEIGKRVIIKGKHNQDIMIYYGYFSEYGKFIHWTNSEQCSNNKCGFYHFVIG